jgi:hypothetical protein
MNDKHITVYTEQGIKIFSKDPNDLRPLKLSEIK